jgi:hypothetical protein
MVGNDVRIWRNTKRVFKAAGVAVQLFATAIGIDGRADGIMSNDEVRGLLQHRSPLVRANAVEALVAPARHDKRLLDVLIAAATVPANKVRLMGTIPVAHVAVGCLLRVGSAESLEAAKALLSAWPEPDRTDLVPELGRPEDRLSRGFEPKDQRTGARLKPSALSGSAPPTIRRSDPFGLKKPLANGANVVPELAGIRQCAVDAAGQVADAICVPETEHCGQLTPTHRTSVGGTAMRRRLH